MSYLPHHKSLARYRKVARGGAREVLGDTADTIANLSSDPYLSELICRVDQLRSIETGTRVPPCPTTRDGMTGGVGLRKAMKPLRAYVWAEQHRWIYPVAAIGVFAVPFLLGMSLGRSR